MPENHTRKSSENGDSRERDVDDETHEALERVPPHRFSISGKTAQRSVSRSPKKKLTPLSPRGKREKRWDNALGEMDYTTDTADTEEDELEVKKSVVCKPRNGICRCLLFARDPSSYDELRSIFFHLTALCWITAWGIIFVATNTDRLDDVVIFSISLSDWAFFISLSCAIAYISVIIQASMIFLITRCGCCFCISLPKLAQALVIQALSSLSFIVTVTWILRSHEKYLPFSGDFINEQDILDRWLLLVLWFGIFYTLKQLAEIAIIRMINNQTRRGKRQDLSSRRAILRKLVGNRPMSHVIIANKNSVRVTTLRRAALMGESLTSDQLELLTFVLQANRTQSSSTLMSRPKRDKDASFDGSISAEPFTAESTPIPVDKLPVDSNTSSVPRRSDSKSIRRDSLVGPVVAENTAHSVDGLQRKAWLELRKSIRTPMDISSDLKHAISRLGMISAKAAQKTQNLKDIFDFMLAKEAQYILASLSGALNGGATGGGNGLSPIKIADWESDSVSSYTLTLQDFEREFKPATARKAWRMFMKVPEARLGQAQIQEGIKAFYQEVLADNQNSSSFQSMGSTIHFVLSFFTYLLLGIVGLTIFDYDVQTTLFTLLTLSGLFTLALGGVISDVMTSLIMVLWQQPFVVGDRIILPVSSKPTMKYWVDQITLLTSTCRDTYGQIHIFPNSSLAKQTIINLSRQNETPIEVIITIDYHTKEAKLKEFARRVSAFISAKRLVWKPKMNAYVYSFDKSQDFIIGYWFVHRAQASSPEIFNDKSFLLEFMREELVNLDIEWRPVPQRYEIVHPQFNPQSKPVIVEQDIPPFLHTPGQFFFPNTPGMGLSDSSRVEKPSQ
eukprot:gb/GEZN01001394.1/.p1 GENE.gb/GEZN01001394.1/~~gb/GEZN01001394.1/.p1  ORF type:complete len:846 (-),score=97.96 gb/GEZN01001394.1/:460-2997(-)